MEVDKDNDANITNTNDNLEAGETGVDDNGTRSEELWISCYEEEANAMEVDKEKDVNTTNANDNLEAEDTGADANDTSNKGTTRKKARKERKKASMDKRER